MPKFFEGFADEIIVPARVGSVQVVDDSLPGFGIRKFAPSRKHPEGLAVYFVRYKIGKRQRRITLGKVVHGNLKSMRLEASKVLAKARLGTDTAADVEAAKAAIAAQGETLGKLAEEYLEARKVKWKPRYYLEVERHLTKDWKGLAGTPIKAIKRQDVVDAIDKIASGRGKVAAADRARAALSGLFTWAIDKGKAEASPVVKIRPRSVKTSRERTLSPMELLDVWNAATVVGGDYERVIKLLILTGQRREEIGGAGLARGH